jgi:hypothetical protein
MENSWPWLIRSKLTGMMPCAYCERPATMNIPSNPERVCFEHALEFWTGLLRYTREHSTCVKHERWCSCRACKELRVSCLRAAAITAAGPSPRERFPIRLAS